MENLSESSSLYRDTAHPGIVLFLDYLFFLGAKPGRHNFSKKMSACFELIEYPLDSVDNTNTVRICRKDGRNFIHMWECYLSIFCQDQCRRRIKSCGKTFVLPSKNDVSRKMEHSTGTTSLPYVDQVEERGTPYVVNLFVTNPSLRDAYDASLASALDNEGVDRSIIVERGNTQHREFRVVSSPHHVYAAAAPAPAGNNQILRRESQRRYSYSSSFCASNVQNSTRKRKRKVEVGGAEEEDDEKRKGNPSHVNTNYSLIEASTKRQKSTTSLTVGRPLYGTRLLGDDVVTLCGQDNSSNNNNNNNNNIDHEHEHVNLSLCMPVLSYNITEIMTNNCTNVEQHNMLISLVGDLKTIRTRITNVYKKEASLIYANQRILTPNNVITDCKTMCIALGEKWKYERTRGLLPHVQAKNAIERKNTILYSVCMPGVGEPLARALVCFNTNTIEVKVLVDTDLPEYSNAAYELLKYIMVREAKPTGRLVFVCGSDTTHTFFNRWCGLTEIFPSRVPYRGGLTYKEILEDYEKEEYLVDQTDSSQFISPVFLALYPNEVKNLEVLLASLRKEGEEVE